MGIFTHISRDVLSLRLAGYNDPIRVNGGRRFWSLDRADWVEAALLHPGERLVSESGAAVAVESTTALPGAIRTYNLDVQIDHRYFVADAAVMTDEHPFCVEGRGWTLAESLRIGDHLLSAEGPSLTVTGNIVDQPLDGAMVVLMTGTHAINKSRASR